MLSFEVILDVFRAANGKMHYCKAVYHRVGKLSFTSGSPNLYIISGDGILSQIPVSFFDCEVAGISVFLEGEVDSDGKLKQITNEVS